MLYVIVITDEKGGGNVKKDDFNKKNSIHFLFCMIESALYISEALICFLFWRKC